MPRAASLLAVDLGAASGRVVAGRWDGARFSLEEVHRFANGPVNAAGSLHWNVLGLWSEIQCGLGKYWERWREAPEGISVDAWGVDFALLDGRGRLLGNPYHYRDARTDGVPERVFGRVPAAEIFAETGVETMQINTLFQLCAMAEAADAQLAAASTLLMIPDFFHYLLSGEKGVEYTEATTTQMYSARRRAWAGDLLDELGIARRILPAVIAPGTRLGEVRGAVIRDAGLPAPFAVIAGASHDAESVFISSGTWSLMGVELDEPVTSDAAFTLNFTNEGSASGRTLLLKNLTGLWTLQECLRVWGREGRHWTWQELMALANDAPALAWHFDPDAAEFLAPDDMPQAIAASCRRQGGAGPETPGAMARAALESLALKYRWTLEALEFLTGRRLETVRIVGGGSRNGLLCQLTADACNRRVVAGPAEASALGNVVVQAVATGHLADLGEARLAVAASAECSEYEPRRSDVWDEAYAEFCTLVGTTL
jgi:rhamnulokinase